MKSIIDIAFPGDSDLDALVEDMEPLGPPQNHYSEVSAVVSPVLDHYNGVEGALVPISNDSHANPWPPKLIVDLALGLDDLETILQRYDISFNEYEAISRNRHFNRELVVMTKELQESGVSFKSKAKLQAETYLEDMDALMNDALTPPTVKTDIFKTLAKLGGLEPERKAEDAAGNNQFNIQINLGPHG